VRLCDANAIGWYLGGSLRGAKEDLQAQVLCWLQCADTRFRPVILAWVLPAISCMQYEKKAFDQAEHETMHLLDILNDYLLTRTFLVGERISLADISLAFDLYLAYEHVIEPGTSTRYQNVTRWFMTIMHQPQVLSVIGQINLCEKASRFDGKKFKENQSLLAPSSHHDSASSPSKQEQGKKDKKKDEKPKDEKPKEEKPKKEEKKPEANDEEMDEAELALAQEPKAKDPFAGFPKSTFSMDDFKRVYSNEDIETKAIPFFWEHLDKENWSIWKCDYKFPKELTIVFMSCNLITGMFQRLDKLRKNAFGSMILFGSDNNSTISGLWIWRGQDLVFPLAEDWQVDYESYEWQKLNPDSPDTKKMVKEYFLWEGDFDGKKFNQGKIFK